MPIPIRIVRSYKTGPVPLDNGHDIRIDVPLLIRLGRTRREEDGGLLAGVRAAEAGGDQKVLADVVAVVPDGLLAGAGVGAAEVDARAGVAHFAVGEAGLGPVGAGAGVLGALGVEGGDFGEVGGGEEGELVFEEGGGLVGGVEVSRGEDGAFVCVVAVDGGDFDEFALVEERVCGVGYEVVVEDGAVGEK